MKQRKAFTQIALAVVTLTVPVQAATAHSSTKQHGTDNQDTPPILLSTWSNSTESYHLFSAAPSTSTQDWHNITETTEAPLARSHDFKHVAFLRTDGRYTSNIYTANMDGTEQTKHYSNRTSFYPTDFIWSHDDNQLFISLQAQSDKITPKTKIIAANLNNHHQKELISGSFEAEYIAASPSGKYLAFAVTAASTKQKQRFTPGIYLYDIAKKRVRGLKKIPSSDPSADVSLAWSPTQNKIAFAETNANSTASNRYSDLFTIDVSTKKVQQITKTDQFESGPTWSPDGTALAFIVRDKNYVGNKVNILTLGSSAPEEQQQSTILTSTDDIRDIFWRG